MNNKVTSVTVQAYHIIQVTTGGRGLYEISGEIKKWIRSLDISTGLLTVFCQHTSASLTIQENADHDVQYDLDAFFTRLVCAEPNLYRHTCEGPDDMPAHIRSALTDCSLSVPVLDGAPALGMWQGIYLFEHRADPKNRQIVLHIIA